MPNVDLLGHQKDRQDAEEAAKQLEQAKVGVNQATKFVKTTISQLDNPELKDQLAQLGEISQPARPEEIRRQAIQKLGDLSDQIKKLQAEQKLQSAREMQSMLRELRGLQGSASRALNLALAKGNFAKAAALTREFQKQLAEGKLTPQQRQALEKQLADLAKQLQRLAQENKELAEELEKAGLDKSLAKLSPEELRKALQRQGLSDKKISELLSKAAASRLASSRCSQLGEAMASCGAGEGGLSGEELAELADQLDSLEALQQDWALTEASLREIDRAIACLGGCDGTEGCIGPWAAGPVKGSGAGTGGPGRGYGPRETGDPENTSTLKTRVKNKSKQGPIIASWHFKGPQVKGEATRERADIVQVAKDRASEAISENRIPRKYEAAVKKYFSQLEEESKEQ